MFTFWLPHEPTFYYSVTKIAKEQWLRFYYQTLLTKAFMAFLGKPSFGKNPAKPSPILDS